MSERQISEIKSCLRSLQQDLSRSETLNPSQREAARAMAVEAALEVLLAVLSEATN